MTSIIKLNKINKMKIISRRINSQRKRMNLMMFQKKKSKMSKMSKMSLWRRILRKNL